MHHQTRGVRTRVMVSALLITLLFSLSLVSASPADETVSLSTGDIDLSFGVKVKLTCNLPVELSTSSYTTEPGKTSTWYVRIYAGTVSLSVYIPSPIDEWYSASRDLTSIGTLYISIISGLSASLRINPSASLTVDGPGSLSTSSVSFDYLGSSETFSVSSYSSASNNARMTVDADFELDLSVGLSVNLFLFSHEIASANIGKFVMSPSVSESIRVSVPMNPLMGFITSPWFIISAFAITSVVAMVAVARRNTKKQEAKRTVRGVSATEQVGKLIPKPPKPPEQVVATKTRPQTEVSRPKEVVYCMYCGEQLPSYAVHCRKCGKKVE